MNFQKRSQPKLETLSNRYIGACLMFLFKDGLSLKISIIDFLLTLINIFCYPFVSFCYSFVILYTILSKLSKDG